MTTIEHRCPTGRHPRPAYGCYTHHGCRCRGCRWANTVYHQERRWERVQAGITRPVLVPTIRARVLVALLRERRLSDQAIAARTGIGRSMVGYLRRGDTDRTRRATVAALERAVRTAAAGGIDVRPPGGGRRRPSTGLTGPGEAARAATNHRQEQRHA